MSEGSAEDVGATDSSISEGRDDQESYAQVDLDSSGSSGFPSTLRGVTQEGSTTVCQLDVGTGEATPCLLDPPSAESLGIYEPLLMSVLTQTDSSWLLSRSLKKTDTSQENLEHAQEASFSSGTSDKGSESFAEIDSILEDDVSDITSKGSLEDLIVHTEFIDDIKPGTLFGSTLYTLPSVGPPTILAYKQESREKPTNYNAVIPKVKDVWLQNIKDLHDVKEYWQWTRNRAAQKELAGTAKQFSQKGESADKPQNLTKRNGEHKWTQFRETVVSIGFDLCQFCGKNLKPLPTPKQLSIETPETLFCCKQYQDLFEFLMREEELIRLKSGLEIIDIAPHLPYSSLLEREQAKERAAMKLRDRALEKYLKSTKEGQSRFTGARKLTTITFQLSTSLDFVTLKDPELKDDEWDNIFTELGGDTFSWHKDLQSSFLVKYYRNGNKFLTTFPDRTAQIFYPSGNLAILIFTDQQKKITCIVQEDRATDPAIQAVFGSYGRCTCYYPNGVVWVNINALGGHYSDKHGTRVKRWCWRDRLSPLIFIPFKPIFISLNENIGVRIIEQERIFVTFLAMGKQAKFKVGTKLKLHQASKQFLTNSWITEDDLLLQASRIKVQTIINKLCIALNFPSNDPEKMALPLYLVSQQQRLSQLYANVKMEESVEVEKVA